MALTTMREELLQLLKQSYNVDAANPHFTDEKTEHKKVKGLCSSSPTYSTRAKMNPES